MRRVWSACRLWVIALLVTLVAASPTPAQNGARELSISEIASKSRAAVVTIYTYGADGNRIALGSGFIAPDGRIVTNRHVVQGASRVEVYGSEGQLLLVAPYLEALSSEMDLAVLPAVPEAPKRLSLAHDIPAVGASIVVLGAPQGLQNSVSEGILSAIRPLNPGRLLQITAPISPGSSGGPVLDRDGDVIGVATMQLLDGQNLNFAVPTEAVRVLLASPPGKMPFPGVVTVGASQSGAAGDVGSVPPAATMGTRWTIVAESPLVAIGVDTSHAEVDENSHRYFAVWARMAWTHPQQDRSTGHEFTTAIARFELDCLKDKVRELQWTVYDQSDALENSITNHHAGWEEPIPDSVGDMLVKGACGKALLDR